MQKETQRFDDQPKVETVTPQFSAFQFYEMFSFIHEYNPSFPFLMFPEVILGSSEEGGFRIHM